MNFGDRNLLLKQLSLIPEAVLRLGRSLTSRNRHVIMLDWPGGSGLVGADRPGEILRLDTRDRFLEQTILYHPHEREFGLGSCLYAPVVL